jgi:ketosteroid isomerase-like protein
LVATDVVFRIAGEEPYVGREAVFARWDRQDELLQDVAYDAELRDLTATNVHVFTYVETWGKVPETGQAFNYTTVTVYRIREGQIVEVRPHVHDLDAYEEFWSSLEGPVVGPAGVPGGGYLPGQPSPYAGHPGGFQRFRLD